MDSASIHIVLSDDAESFTVLHTTTQLLSDKYGRTLATIQCEPSTFVNPLTTR